MLKKSNETWLIVGLGNPGKDYERTRHNCGFRAVDLLAEQLGCKIDKGKFQGLYGQALYQGKKLMLLKPQTYMNLSGRSVLQLSAYFSIPPQRIIVLFDDISLPPGRLRIRPDGSATMASNPSLRSWEARISPGSRSVWVQKPIPNRIWRITFFPPSPPWRKRLWRFP